MYCRRTRQTNALKSFRSWVLMWVSFVTGVGINLSPLESRFIWACVSSKFERFLMYRWFVSCFFLINIAPKLFSLFMAFDRSNIILFEFFHSLLDIFNFLNIVDSIWVRDRSMCRISRLFCITAFSWLKPFDALKFNFFFSL